MKTFPTQLTSVFNDVTKEPRYLIRFFGVESLGENAFSADFTTGPVSSQVQSYYQLMDWPRGNTQTVEMEMGRSTIGQLQFGLLDQDRLITKYISNPGAALTNSLSGAATTVAASIAGGLNNAYPPFGTILIRSVIEGAEAKAGGQISRLEVSISPQATTIPSSGVGAFPTSGFIGLRSNLLSFLNVTHTPEAMYLVCSIAGGLANRFSSSGVLRVESEQIFYPFRTGSTFGSPSSKTTRGYNNTSVVTHLGGTSVYLVNLEWIGYTAVTNSGFGTGANPVSRGLFGEDAEYHTGEDIYPSINISSIFEINPPLFPYEYISYSTVTESTFGTPATPVSRGVWGSTAQAWSTPKSVQNAEQIRPGTRCQLFVGDSTVPFSAYASWVRMEVFRRGKEGNFYNFDCQDSLRFIRRYAFLNAAEITNSADYTIIRSGKPLELLLQVWTTTSGGGNGAYDRADGTGAALPQNLVTVNSIIALQNSHYPNDIYVFKFRSPIDVKDWSEKLLRSLNAFPIVTQSGMLSVRRYATTISVNDAVDSLTMDTIVGVPGWDPGDQAIANVVAMLYDWGGAGRTSDYATRDQFIETESVRKYGRRAATPITAPGIRTVLARHEIGSGTPVQVLSGDELARLRCVRFLQRFSEPLDTLVVEAHYSKIRLEPGDVVTVTHSWIPDVLKGALGIATMPFEVLDSRPVFSPAEGSPRTQLRLLRIRI